MEVVKCRSDKRPDGELGLELIVVFLQIHKHLKLLCLLVAICGALAVKPRVESRRSVLSMPMK